MTQSSSPIETAALDWVVRLGDPAFEDWETFAAWLESDPRHAEAYHALEADAADMATIIPAPVLTPVHEIAPPARRPARRAGWMMGAVAASVAALVGYQAIRPHSDPYVIQTAPGETRQVDLGDGSHVALNGDTKLTLDHADPRIASLDRGEAYFSIRHDEAHPFRVSAGDKELLDVGTAFDVTHEDGRLRVGVSEGAVMFDPDHARTRLDKGRALEFDERGGVVRLSAVAPDSVGGWRQGSLDYVGAPLRQVAADLSRQLGVRITVAPALLTRPFQGTIALDGLKEDPSRLAPLLDAQVRRAGDAWEIAPLP
ncbi:DUF4880 domain-containing protein [Sphingomonas sp. AP4-R1]|uniref:FecR family protein n=1 Tax=Sphingomonas sp. AP4-R1 TaxID=2735134 RepID=UPI0014933F65|nr:FecR domain-containing protein [Sphingomonas sp. AP4-R1]QJU58556.1 DUF4880 domain-containing protein [Sphingomonas sp. AP4-R1]